MTQRASPQATCLFADVVAACTGAESVAVGVGVDAGTGVGARGTDARAGEDRHWSGCSSGCKVQQARRQGFKGGAGRSWAPGLADQRCLLRIDTAWEENSLHYSYTPSSGTLCSAERTPYP